MAAKFIHKRLTDIDHVETEYNTLQALQHEHLIPVYDIYTTKSSYVIIMPL
jgi:serine/threonine protein kinase